MTAAMRALLAKKSHFTVGQELKTLTETSVGRPRETHFRKVIKALFKAGETITNGVGPVQNMVVRRP